MSKKRLPDSNPQVKRKTRRVIHTVEDGFAVTIRELTRGMAPDCVGKTRRGRINNSAYHIKKAALAWADAFPKKINGVPTGFTPAVREVFKTVVWSHLMDRGYAVFSYDGLADTARCHRDTAKDAVNYLRARGLLQWKTGKGWGRKERRSLANQYTVNLWAFINPETGTIVAPPYHTGIYEWEMTAAGFRARIKEGPYTENTHMVAKQDVGLPGVGRKNGGHGENTHMVKGKKRRNHAKPYGENTHLYSDNGIADASLPASADATASAAPLPEHESDSVKIRFVRLDKLAAKLNKHPVALMKLFEGAESSEIGTAFDALCKDEIFTWGKPRACLLEHTLPNNGTQYGHVIVHGDQGRVDFVEGGDDRLSLNDLKFENWTAIEYRVSPEYQIKVAAKLEAIRTGV